MPGVFSVHSVPFRDARGERYEAFRANYIPCPAFVVSNIAYNTPRAARGLHYQTTDPQGKLVRCVRGEIMDIGLDLRRSSQTFGRASVHQLSGHNHTAVYWPPGFAHGFADLGAGSVVVYECTSYFDEASTKAVSMFDNFEGSNISIWPDFVLGNGIVVSDKDRIAPLLAALTDDDTFA